MMARKSGGRRLAQASGRASQGAAPREHATEITAMLA